MRALATSGRRRSEALTLRVQALESALEAGRGWLDGPTVERGEQVAAQARARLDQSVDHTVVALAGSTGSGKSSIFNVLAGHDLATPGVRRPTTSRAMAAVWEADPQGAQAASRLLDWLDVPLRTFLEPGADNQGLVLLDLPDHDSVVVEHRVRSDLLVDRADLLVWVVDPQKYADAVLHEQYLRPLAGHAGVVVLVLNQIDRLSHVDQLQCLADLRRLAAQDGLGSCPVIGLSAVTGQGVGELRSLVASAAAAREAATSRLLADVRAAAERVSQECGPAREVRNRAAARGELTTALLHAARADVVVDAVRASSLLRARAATGWPLTRWVGRLRSDPLRRLNLLRRDVRTELSRTSLPPMDAAMAAKTHTAVREYVDGASAGAPAPWVLATRALVRDDGLPDALDQAVARTELDGERRPRWWSVASAVQWAAVAVLLVGVLWLAGLAVLSFIQLPVASSPDIEGYPIPTLLVVVGLLLGVILALLARLLSYIGANRAARRAERRLRVQVSAVASLSVVEPVEAQRHLLDECRAAAALAAR